MTDIQEKSLAKMEKPEAKDPQTINGEIAEDTANIFDLGIDHNLLITDADSLPNTLIGLVDDSSFPESLDDLPREENSFIVDSAEFTTSPFEFQDGSGRKPEKKTITRMEA